MAPIRSLAVVAGLLGVLLGGGVASAETFKFSDALCLAYETNPQIGQARAALEALDQGVAQANAGWRPTISVSGSYGFEQALIDSVPNSLNSRPTNAQISVSQPIFRGGQTFAEVKQAIAQVDGGRAQLLATEQSVLLSAVTAYMDVVRDTRSLEINQANVRSLETEYTAVRTEFGVGEVTRTDVSQGEARLAGARAQEAIALQQLVASRAEFENVIGRPAPTLQSDVAPPKTPATLDAAMDLALKGNPSIVQARANEHATQYEIDDAVGALLPHVSVVGQYQYLKDMAGTDIFATNSRQRVLNVMAQVNVPIYQGGAEEATVRRAKDFHAQSDFALLSAERDVRQTLASTWQALLSAELAISASQTQAASNQSALNGVNLEQKAGERSVLDYLNAQQELFSAQIALAVAQHNRIIAAHQLLAATGQLTAQYLGLNVKLYDPLEHYNKNADAWFSLDE